MKAKRKSVQVAAAKAAPETTRRQSKALSPESRLETAHTKFIQTREGTAEYARAWETLLDTLVDE